MMKQFCILLVLVTTRAVFAVYSNDMTCCSCHDLKPFRPHNATLTPQVIPSPFKIIVHQETYRPDEEVKVDIITEGDYAFRDFMLVAWPTDNKPRNAIGKFELLEDRTKYSPKFNCYSTEHFSQLQYAIQTADHEPKQNLRFSWETRDYRGHIEFRATFIVNDDVYWVAEKSALLLDTGPNAPPIPKTDRLKVTLPINVEECGISKGCYREPAGCWEPHCEYIVTWLATTDKIQFELGGLADNAGDRFVAVGLSNDTYMGEDIVFACAHNSEDDSTEVYISYNEHNNNIPLNRNRQRLQNRKAISDEEGAYHNGRLRCRFSVDQYLEDFYPELHPIDDLPYYLLMARGFARKGTLRQHGLGVNELPIASPSKIYLRNRDNIGDRARYPLVKAHGCLMILAWVFFASIGLLMTKYYKTMWPNKRMFDQRYWFVKEAISLNHYKLGHDLKIFYPIEREAHYNCMASVFLVTIIAVILIFIEADGWSKAPDLPQRAHPILGIIIFVCIIINPILALLRPNENSKCRPVFNWFHWAFGTIANVLAIPTIFIGMDFGKANVPWWATWILVIWVIFHIVIELSLEVHQCCTYKKNKERRKKYEQQKKESPKLHIEEPEPVGRRFKRFMLFLHLIVTTIITLIMIIVIAVA